jgi:MFS superfamily sulfate permease-like transporter
MDTDHARNLSRVSLAVLDWKKAQEVDRRAAQRFEEARADYHRTSSDLDVCRKELDAAYRDLEEG